MLSGIISGNAEEDGRDYRQWFIGDLESWNPGEPGRAPHALRTTQALEIKWGVHPKGEQRPGGWEHTSPKTTLSLLVSGCFSLQFRQPGAVAPEQEYRLEQAGDYVLWRERIEHTWQAEEASVVLTVRWLD